MKTTAMILCAITAANFAFADVYTSALSQARNVAAGQPPQGSTPPPAPPPQQSTPPAPPPNPVLEATLKNISNLRIDFDAIGKLTEVKPDSPQKKLLLTDLTAAPMGTKPSDSTISALADNLASAVVGKDALKPQHAKLAQEIHAIFNSSHLSAEQQQKIFDDVQKILTDGGASADDTINVVSSIKTIATETK
jgi:hypothetical protein